MKFKNKFSGIIEEPNDKIVAQYTKRPELWEPVKEKGAKAGTGTEPNYKELKDLATNLGLEFPSNIKKDALVELIKQHNENAGANDQDDE